MKLKTVHRLDSIPLTPAYFTPEGYLRDRPIVTTCGIFEYLDDDGGITRELRLPEEVFAEKSLASYEGKPIIITHDAGAVNKDNVADEHIGTILSPGLRDGNNVRAEIIIHDTKSMKSCGLKELSLGYDVDIDETPGTYKGQPYDVIQRNIKINHLALVDEARAGHTARLNLDGKNKNRNPKKGGKGMRKRKRNVDGAELTPEQLAEAIAMYMAANSPEAPTQDEGEEEGKSPLEQIRENADRRDEDIESISAEEIPEMHEEIKTLLNEIDQLQGQQDMTADEEDKPVNQDEEEPDNTDEEDTPDNQDEEEPDNTDDDDTQAPEEDTAVKMDAAEKTFSEMYAICQMAAKLNLDNFTPRSVMDGKKAIIKSVNPKVKLDGKSRAYINGAYEVACSSVKARKTTDSQKKRAFGDRINLDSLGESEAEKARKRMVSNMTKGGKA